MKIQICSFLGIGLMAYTSLHAPDALTANDIRKFTWAEYLRYAGKGKEASMWWNDLLVSDPSPYAYKGYVKFLSQTGNAQSVVKIYEQHKDNFANDETVQLIFAQALESLDRESEALELLASLVDKFKKNAKIALYTAQMYMKKQEFTKALNIIDTYLNAAPKTPNNYIFYFLKAQIYTQKDDPHNALLFVQKSLKAYPQFDKGWLMYAALKEQAGHLQEAINGYTTFLRQTNRPNFSIQKYLMNLVFRQKTLEQQTNNLLADKTLLEQSLLLFKNKQYEQAIEKADECITQDPKNTEAKLLKVQIYTSMHQYKKAAKVIEAFAIDDPENDTWYQALHLLCRSGLSYPKAIKILAAIEQKHPKVLNCHLYLCDLFTRDKQYTRAIDQHNKALAITSDATLQARLYFNLAIIQYQQKNYTPMLTALKEVQKREASFLPALNLEAYYYATKGKQLDTAKKLVAKALKKDPKNPHYLDTQAVILYKEKKYDQAHKLLQKLAQAEPHDATIMKHLAKVQFKMGNKDQARTILSQATLCADAQEKKACESLLKRWKL